MKKNIQLFTWEEKYLIFKEIKKRKQLFAAKYWQDNIFQFHWENISYSRVKNTIFSWGLFAEKKLILIFGIPRDSDKSNYMNNEIIEKLQDDIHKNIDSIWNESVLLLISFKPDKRTKFYKFLSQNITQKNFAKKNMPQIKQIVKDFFGNIKITDENLQYFINKIWKDLFVLESEAKKLSSYAEFHNKSVSKEMIDKIVFSQKDINVFEIIDIMFSDKEKSIDFIQQVKKSWTDEFQFLGVLYWWIKTTLQMTDLYSQWIKDSKTIAKQLSLHPFVVSKNINKIPKLSTQKSRIKSFYYWLIELDFGIKSWDIPGENLWLELKKLIYTF